MKQARHHTADYIAAPLLSPELLALITSYQKGIYEDMLPFLAQEVPTWTLEASDVSRSKSYNAIRPSLLAWLGRWRLGRLPTLFDCLPFLRDVVLFHAVKTHDMALVDWFLTHMDAYLRALPLFLLDLAADANALDVMLALHGHGHQSYSDGAIKSAIQHCNLPMLHFLRDQTRSIVPDFDVHCIGQAIAQGKLDVVQWLLNNGQLSDVTSASLVHAARSGHLETLTLLHDAGYGNDVDRMAVTRAAASFGHVHIVRWLFSPSSSWGSCPRCALDAAEDYDRVVTARVLQAILQRKDESFPCDLCVDAAT
ncbi:Aste57867_24303 [Aphanomyces stellatus]|uniref:Aste57867_24303 protein n=1 Tax=Aphanomyces stellatus TaxID=120398 RepID=A0A485LQ52_9STRA|nr:hypothetical protein As57867_024228 [Aphanomyces stellatus]VFU00943.1 Aste57867_24303 [Aphanomyces stellatus]